MASESIKIQNLFINGQLVDGDGFTDDVDPATGEVFMRVAVAGDEQVGAAVTSARDAFKEGTWAGLRPVERARILLRLSEAMTRNSEDLAALESRDTGKPLSKARADVANSARYFEYYAGLADKLHGDSIPLGPGTFDLTVREPVGVSAQIVPWNFPLSMTSRGVAPALAAGCSVVVKAAPDAPLSPIRLGELAFEAGIPAGVLNVISGPGLSTGRALVSNPDIDQVTFTGSVEAGKSVARAAAANLVPAVLELGGKSPHLVFSDADLDLAIPIIANSIFSNSGQTCTAGSRLIVERSLHEEVIERLRTHVATLTMGPGSEDADLGPIINAVQLDSIHSKVQLAVSQGATVVTGGSRPTAGHLARGFYYEPTILSGVTQDMDVARDEVFGPVLSVLTFEGIDDAIDLANSTDFGLTSAVWTRDVNVALRVATELESGQVSVNAWGAGSVETPFGGVKQSGYGREKSLEGIQSYLRTKNVYLTYRM